MSRCVNFGCRLALALLLSALAAAAATAQSDCEDFRGRYKRLEDQAKQLDAAAAAISQGIEGLLQIDKPNELRKWCSGTNAMLEKITQSQIIRRRMIVSMRLSLSKCQGRAAEAFDLDESFTKHLIDTQEITQHMQLGLAADVNCKITAPLTPMIECSISTSDDNDRRLAACSRLVAEREREGNRSEVADAYNRRAIVYSVKRDFGKAIADAGRAIALEPEIPEYYNDRANFYLEAKRAQDGLPDAERAVQLDPKSAEAIDTRGQILLALGRRSEAIADFRRALKLNPEQQESKDALARLGEKP